VIREVPREADEVSRKVHRNLGLWILLLIATASENRIPKL
jgi:hypothetical protein